MSDLAPIPNSPQYTCPNCGHSLAASEVENGIVTCPGCQEAVSIGSAEPSEIESAQSDQAVKHGEEDLSALRIHQISAMRRGAYRTRSWLIIAAVVCLAGAAQLIYLAARDYRVGHRLVPLGDVIAAIVALMVCPYFVRRALKVNREIHHSLLEEPQSPPDFSTLSDGSQRWKNLEAMTEDPDKP